MTRPTTRPSSRPRALMSALLLSTAAMSPAFAQDAAEPAVATGSEEVTVTAARAGSAQSIQKIPVAVTAISSKDLETKSIESFRDLQFNVPSVTYSNGQYGASNFQIRGIGISSVAASADSGVSIHTNDVYNYTGGLMSAEYFDLERIEVLRGPQSTLYGRNATGGVVNIITAKPVLDENFGHTDLTYGSYNTVKGNLMLNAAVVPDELGFRLAYNYSRHDGYVENLYTGNDTNSQNLHQVRASLRWEPSSSTTIDLIGSYSFEKDSLSRYPKQLCHRDPTGVLGCLPDKLDFEAVNSFATLGTLISSKQYFTSLGLGPLGGLLGLTDITDPAGGNALSPVPRDMYKIVSDIDPTFRATGEFYMGSLRQEITPWLTMNALVNYSEGQSDSTNHYNNLIGDDYAAQIPGIIAGLQALGGQAYIDQIFTAPDGSFQFPKSIPASGGLTAGAIPGQTVDYSTRSIGSDLITSGGKQTTAEVRFTTDLDGPVNFLFAGFMIDATTNPDYYVTSTGLDYAGTILGLLSGGIGATTPVVLAPTYFLSNTEENHLKSKALFGEVYYQVTDDFKLTGGLRYTEDKKEVHARQLLFQVPVALGTTNLDGALLSNGIDLDPVTPGAQIMAISKAKFDAWTGRAVAEWTPDFDWSDSTLIYASYSRGFKSGGLNPPVDPQFNVPPTFEPEQINAYEIGTKNRFMDNALTLNITGYYYDYKGYQIADIVARTAVNSNIDATVWGLEGEALYRLDDHWQFNLTVTHSKSEIGDAAIVDQRNPGAGRSDAVVIKNVANGAICVYTMGAAAGGKTPSQNGFNGYTQPTGGSQALAQYGVPNVDFGTCSSTITNADGSVNTAETARFNEAYTLAPDGTGLRQSIEGNELPQQPSNTLSFGVQYTTDVADGYEVVLRGDYYLQDSMWSRIINGPADKIDSWDVLNASIQLNAVDQGWYAKLYATNILDSQELTGSFLTDASSGLFSNAFVQDPRIIGLTVGVDF